MNISNKTYNSRTKVATAIVDGIKFNNIQGGGISKGDIMSMDANVWTGAASTWIPAINAVDINWNDAELPNGSSTGGSITINSTGELLSLINNMQDEIYVLTAAVIALSNV